jgi:hypothetical protein
MLAWIPGKIKDIKGDFCTVEIEKNGRNSSLIINKKNIRKIVE